MTQKETKGLIWIEQQPYMHALLTMNALMNDIDTDNIILGSCFDYESEDGRKPTKCIINPPYGLGKGLTELDVRSKALKNMEVGGKRAAIVPMSTAIDCKKSKLALRKELLENNTLDAVISMPEKLFEGTAGIITCIIVFTAGVPHNSKKKTWFGYWKDDGFVKTKTEGRIDKYNKWNEIYEQWINDFINQEERPGQCVRACITAEDEWCAEVYLETDYSQLTKDDFKKQLMNYEIFKLANNEEDKDDENN